MKSVLFFQPFVEPFEESPLPEDTILRFQHPVVFVGIYQQFRRNSTHDGRIESRHRLIGKYTVVFLAMDAKNRSVPTVDKRSEEHTSELQSRQYLVCRLLLEQNS